MNLQTLALYVNLDVDDTFEQIEITQWFNKGIAQFNLLPPVTEYPMVELEGLSTDVEAVAANIYVDEDYPLSNNFMLGIMLPFIASSVRGQDSSVTEKQLYLQEFLNYARTFKTQENIPLTYLKDKANTDLDAYKLGDNVYISDMRRANFAGDWSLARTYTEVASQVTVVFKDLDADLAITYGNAAFGSALSNFVTDAELTGENFYLDQEKTLTADTTSIITADIIIYHSGS